MSIDFVSWPSVFDNKAIGIGLNLEHKRSLGLDGFPMPSWVGANFPFWDDLTSLESHSKKHCSDYLIIKVFKFHGQTNTISLEEECGLDTKEEWSLNGFDVADAGFNSVLTNCASPIIGSGMKHKWSLLLNSDGLFVSQNDALEWMHIISGLFPELPPLAVYALWERHRKV